MSQEIIDLLTRQNELLQQLLQAQQSSPARLGWSTDVPGQAKWLFVGRTGDYCLYSLTPDDKKVSWEQSTVTGYITGIDLLETERLNQPSTKLNVSISTGDNKFVISTGADTHCAKSLLGSLMQLDRAALKSPISLTFAPSDGNPSIVWCRVSSNGSYVKAQEYGSTTNIVVELNNRLGVESDPIQASRTNHVAKPATKPQLKGNHHKGANAIADKPQAPAVSLTTAPLNTANNDNNRLIGKIRQLTGHNKDWIVSQCAVFGKNEPKWLDSKQLGSLVEAIAVDHLYCFKHAPSRETASSVYRKQVFDIMGNGIAFDEAVIKWFGMYCNHSQVS